MNETVKKALEAERLRMEKKYGHKSAAIGSDDAKYNVIPTGVLALDYALGTGGWPLGQIIEVYGPPDIGKTSVLGYSAYVEAQKLGLVCGLVALEPNFDKAWAAKNGVDVDSLIIGRPDDGDDSFHMLYDWVTGSTVDFIIFDSIGQVLRASEVDEKGKASVGGASALISWGIKRCVMPAWKRNKTVILINQVRDDMDSPIAGMVEAPGGWAKKHASAIRVYMRPGRERFTIKENDGNTNYDLTIGQEIVCKVMRNKLTEGTNARASFNYFQKEVDGQPFGIDRVTDVLRTAMRTGVISRAGAYYHHHTFPELGKEKEHKLYGKEAVATFFDENPKAVEVIRHEVLTVMIAKEKAKEDGQTGNG